MSCIKSSAGKCPVCAKTSLHIVNLYLDRNDLHPGKSEHFILYLHKAVKVTVLSLD